jgi:hypothetical protein
MDEKQKSKIIRELTLVLISLTGWEEDNRNTPGKKVFRAWEFLPGTLFKKITGCKKSLKRIGKEKLYLPPSNLNYYQN